STSSTRSCCRRRSSWEVEGGGSTWARRYLAVRRSPVAFPRQQHVPDPLDVDGGFARTIDVGSFVPRARRLLGHAVQQVSALLEHPERDPEAFLDLFRLRGDQCLCRE